MKRKALKCALPLSAPIALSFLALGAAFGLYITGEGFPFWMPIFMSTFIFAGSMEILTVSLLLSAFDPLQAFLLTLVVNARHLFYGISMLEKYKGTGWKKGYLIFGMCDETFSILCSTSPPPDVDKSWFMFFVTLCNHMSWVSGAAIGALAGAAFPFSTTGLDFILTALFMVTLLGQCREKRNRIPAAIGLCCSLVCRVVLGPDQFMVPAMLLMLAMLLLCRAQLSSQYLSTKAGASK